MDAITLGLNKLVGGVTTAASDAAAAKAAAAYEQWKPLIWVAALMALLVFFLYFVPRFRLPWQKTTA